MKALHSVTNEMKLFVLSSGHGYLFLLTSMYDFYGLVSDYVLDLAKYYFMWLWNRAQWLFSVLFS